MVLPLYATIERFNFSLVEAAQDLGANDLRTFIRVVLPLTMRGIVAGSLLVFRRCIIDWSLDYDELTSACAEFLIGNDSSRMVGGLS